MGRYLHHLALKGSVLAAVLVALAVAPSTAAATNSASFTCTFHGTATLTPSLALTGGWGTYTLSGSLPSCASSGNYAVSSSDPFTSQGTYTSSSVCGNATLSGTYTLGSPGHALSGAITMNSIAGAGPLSVTVKSVDTGASTGPVNTTSSQGGGVAGFIPMPNSPGPSDCADSLAINGQLAATFSF